MGNLMDDGDIPSLLRVMADIDAPHPSAPIYQYTVKLSRRWGYGDRKNRLGFGREGADRLPVGAQINRRGR